MATGRTTSTLEGYEDAVSALAFSPGGKTLFTNGGAKDIRFTDLATGHDSDLPSKIQNVHAAVFSPDGKIVAYGNNNDSVLLHVASGRTLAILKWVRANSMAFSLDGKTVAIGDITGNIEVCDVGGRRITARLGNEVQFSGAGMVYSVAFSPDGRTLASANQAPGTSTVRLWDLAAKRIVRNFGNANHPVVFSPDGKTLATSVYGAQGGVQLWKAT